MRGAAGRLLSGALFLAGCGGRTEPEAAPVEAEPADVAYGARWVDGRAVALCRSDARAGRCTRVYFRREAGADVPGFPAGWALGPSQRGAIGVCGPGRIPASAAEGVRVEGTAAWSGPEDPVTFDFDLLLDGGDRERFVGRVRMGRGPCP